jgi:hypothetical protein
MTRFSLPGVVLAVGLALAGAAFPAAAQETQAPAQGATPAPVPGPAPTGPLTEVKVGYLGLQNDVRYHPEIAYARIQLSPEINPVEGARLGIDDLRIVDNAVNLNLSLDEQMAKDGTTRWPRSRRWLLPANASSSSTCRGTWWRN